MLYLKLDTGFFESIRAQQGLRENKVLLHLKSRLKHIRRRRHRSFRFNMHTSHYMFDTLRIRAQGFDIKDVCPKKQETTYDRRRGRRIAKQ